MNPSTILMGFLFFVLQLPGAKAPASLPGMYFPASLPRAASFTSAGDLSAHRFPTKSALRPPMFLGALRPLMLLSAMRPGTIFAGIASADVPRRCCNSFMFEFVSRPTFDIIHFGG